MEFLNDLQIRCIREQKRFLKQELKLTALITDLNMHSRFPLNEVREHLDFVDNHQYWDHPSFPVRQWGMPYLFSNMSSISRFAQNPRVLMPARIFGKRSNPFDCLRGAVIGIIVHDYYIVCEIRFLRQGAPDGIRSGDRVVSGVKRASARSAKEKGER